MQSNLLIPAVTRKFVYVSGGKQVNLKSKRNPVEVAKEILKSRYPNAVVGFVAGSFNRGEETAYSDIDLIVVFEKVEFAWRESFTFADWPVEVFAHDPETLNYFFREVDGKDGVPSLMFMVLEGTSIPDNHELSFQLKSLANQVLYEKPPAWSEETIYHQRYGLTDLIDDLRAPRNSFEAHIIIGAIHEMLGNFYFRSQRIWSASRKHIPRRIIKINPTLGKEWVDVFEAAYAGNYHCLIDFTQKILKPYGGFLFNEYRRNAPANWRKPLSEQKNIYEGAVPEVPLLAEEREVTHPMLGLLRFRTAKSLDVPQLRKLLNTAYKKLLGMGLNYNATFQDDALTAKGLFDGGSVLVVENKNGIIGTMRIKEMNSIDDRKCLYLSRFAVAPEFQKSGLGTILLGLAEKIARRNEFKCMQLDTAQPAKHLVSFYESQGFQIKRPIYYDGKTYISWILEKTF